MSAQVDGQMLPALPVHALSPIHPMTAPSAARRPPSTEMPRSASYTYVPILDTTESPESSLKRNFSENVLALPPESKVKVSDSVHTANMELFRRASRKAKKRMSTAIFSLSPDDDESPTREGRKRESDREDAPKSLGRSVAGTLRTFARKSWATSSRPQSPAGTERLGAGRKTSASPSKHNASKHASPATSTESIASRPPSEASFHSFDTSPVDALKPHDRPSIAIPVPKVSAIEHVKSKSELNLQRLSRNSSATSLKSLGSRERSRSRMSLAKVPALPTSYSSDRLVSLNVDFGKRRDPLWAAFRGIEGDYVTFQAKTSLQKAKVLRTDLIPFLAKYAHHPSTRALRVEDLDRRTVILNKWWTGLLEMLHGANNQSISGTDRPAFLEAATMIMLRPEWRIPGFIAAPGEASSRNSISKSKSTMSGESEEADFLTETIHQNVRNTFVQNLLSQLEFVTEKLSFRAAPASLVTFAGKTCAYAFFFCPGVADMLVRLWRIPSGTLRRVFAECGVGYADRLVLTSSALARSFPPPVRSLSVTSQVALARHLQRRHQVPPGSASINWNGPWVARWAGQDTDLFFAFTKHYHLLASEFLPDDMPAKDRCGIPGLVPVCAQMLVVLETTIYRQAGQHAVNNYAPGTSLDMDYPDAMAPLPMTIANASRSIAENRLIILLRDVLAESHADRPLFQTLFVGSFDNATKAATRRISVYNNDACFVICDFVEEVLPIMFRYHQTFSDTPVLDWPFWLLVCKQMMQTQTTLTQIRLMAFLYTTWSILVLDEQRKRQLVLDWLLNQDVFERNYCHWSPMVRHYFYRLLCWRVARYDGPVSDLDVEILTTLATRLNRCWAHYQYLLAEAEMRGHALPSSIPCSPAPSRLLIIVRTDSQPVLAASRATFENLLSTARSASPSPYQIQSSAIHTIPVADQAIPGTKKRWGLFRGLNMFSSPGNTRPGEVTPPGSPDETESASPVDSGVTSPVTPCSATDMSPVTPPHQPFSFKFSLEWTPRETLPTKNRILAAPLLPPNAQHILRAHSSAEKPSDPGNDSGIKSKAPGVQPLKPSDHEMATARYSGRALAEWAIVVGECRGFFFRRKQEGVPRDSLVETPTLGVENFRMMG